MQVRRMWIAWIVGVGVGWTVAAEPGDVSPAVGALGDEVRTQWPGVLAELDSPDFAVRQRASERVQAWLARSELRAVLAEAFQKALLDPATSFEVRSRMERWSRGLPAVATPTIADVSGADLDRLVRQLDDDSYAVREGAKQRLRWYLESPSLAVALMQRLKLVVLDPRTPGETQQRLEPYWQQARGAWLLSDPAQWKLPPVSDEQIGNWIEALAQPAAPSASGDWPAHVRAERELLDLLARDDDVPRVTRLLKGRLATLGRGPEADRLQAVLDWTRPAMVAEYWEGRRHKGEQHLLVGVPSQADTALRPSHFDYIDDKVAHCVSGATLSPGMYPAMEAFPHPRAEMAFFHLVNLPTARRRMTYPYYVQRPEAQRLSEISRRTLDRWLAGKKEISVRDAVLLLRLDAREVSRFAGRYFLLMPDEPLHEEFLGEPSGRAPTRHALLCGVLVSEGTREAIPGLREAIEKQRFLPPTRPPFYQLPWCAALNIAQRDPWPDVESWLAGLIGHTDPLLSETNGAPDVGATAAALLLARHRRDPAAQGLQATYVACGEGSNVITYRFNSDSDRRQAIEWWEEQKPR